MFSYTLLIFLSVTSTALQEQGKLYHSVLFLLPLGMGGVLNYSREDLHTNSTFSSSEMGGSAYDRTD
jgi:hypothetical protein